MHKEILLDSIIKEMKIIRRLGSKVTMDNINYRPKEGMRSMLELLQYLSYCGTAVVSFWYRKDGSDIKTFYAPITEKAKTVTLDQFVALMDEQIEKIKILFDNITDDDLENKVVEYPWKETARLREAILVTSIKWLTAYKTQLFLYLKLSTENKFTTPDLWRLTEITA
jgi:hypothetical protein